MAKTKNSVRGVQNKKIVVVKNIRKKTAQELENIEDQHQIKIWGL